MDVHWLDDMRNWNLIPGSYQLKLVLSETRLTILCDSVHVVMIFMTVGNLR